MGNVVEGDGFAELCALIEANPEEIASIFRQVLASIYAGGLSIIELALYNNDGD